VEEYLLMESGRFVMSLLIFIMPHLKKFRSLILEKILLIYGLNQLMAYGNQRDFQLDSNFL